MSEPTQPTQPLRTVFVGNGATIYPLHERAADPARFQLVGMADIDPQAKARADAHGVPFFSNHLTCWRRCSPNSS